MQAELGQKHHEVSHQDPWPHLAFKRMVGVFIYQIQKLG